MINILQIRNRLSKIILWVMLAFSIPGSILAQDLEPRFLSPAPTGMNFAILGYGYSTGNVLLDRALPLEDTESKLHSVTAIFARSLNLFGFSGRVQAALPFVTATWYADVNGQDSSTTRNGIGDAIIALAVDFIGAPALKGKEFIDYKRKTIVGMSLKVRMPIGQYNGEEFFNLGTNRWSIGVRIGLSQKLGRFVFEGYLNGWFFTTNTNFDGGNKITQNPIFAAQIHVTYLFQPGIWAALSFGQSYGGEISVNEAAKENTQKNNRFGATFSLPVSSKFSFKFAYTMGITTRYGADFNTTIVVLQYRWGEI